MAEVYDHQCAACGLRLRLPGSDIALVDAAHLIPFAVSFNDHPSNGLALCKNHHWAMDRSLIAPHPEGRWVVSRVLISHRSSGEAELAKLQDKPLLPPADEAFRPAVNAMRWRVVSKLKADDLLELFSLALADWNDSYSLKLTRCAFLTKNHLPT